MSASTSQADVRRFDASDPADVLRVRRQTNVAILALALAVIGLAASLQVTPDQQGVSLLGVQLPELCAARRMGSTCPGCGLTRSFVLGVRLDPQAFRLHPLGPVLLGLLALQFPYRSYRLFRARHFAAQGRYEEALRRVRWPTISALLLTIALLIAIWLLRVWA